MGIRRLTLTRAIRVARGNDVACREAGDTKSTLITASWPSYTLLSMPARTSEDTNGGQLSGVERAKIQKNICKKDYTTRRKVFLTFF